MGVTISGVARQVGAPQQKEDVRPEDKPADLVGLAALFGIPGAAIGIHVGRKKLHERGLMGTVEGNARQAQRGYDSLAKSAQKHLDGFAKASVKLGVPATGVLRGSRGVDWDYDWGGFNGRNPANPLPWSLGFREKRMLRNAEKVVNRVVHKHPDLAPHRSYRTESTGSILMGLLSEGNAHMTTRHYRAYAEPLANAVGAIHRVRQTTSASSFIEEGAILREALDGVVALSRSLR